MQVQLVRVKNESLKCASCVGVQIVVRVQKEWFLGLEKSVPQKQRHEGTRRYQWRRYHYLLMCLVSESLSVACFLVFRKLAARAGYDR